MPVHELIITGASFPPASVRGVIQSLEPITESANVVRDVNGGALDIGNPDFRKLASTLSCTDQVPPELTALWPGVTCTITCVSELSYHTATGGPIRPVYSSRVDGDWTFYRPILEMVVTTPWQITDERYKAIVSWQLRLQER